MTAATNLLAPPVAASPIDAPEGVNADGFGANNVGGPGTASCGGLAPVVTACTTGAHDYVFVLVHGCAPPNTPVPYTGIIESQLVGPGTLRRFFCWYVNGVFQTSCGVGAFPPPFPQIFVHNGFSYDYVPPPVNVPPAGVCVPTPLVAGGVGNWGVTITHD